MYLIPTSLSLNDFSLSGDNFTKAPLDGKSKTECIVSPKFAKPTLAVYAQTSTSPQWIYRNFLSISDLPTPAPPFMIICPLSLFEAHNSMKS